jgi:hypothetical protein
MVTRYAYLPKYIYLIDFFLIGASSGTTIAGQSAVSGSWSYQFSSPTSIIFDQYGNMYVMDAGNNQLNTTISYYFFLSTLNYIIGR